LRFLRVYNTCNANTDNVADLGLYFVNDTRLPRARVFTGSPNFITKEIEMFEITGQIAHQIPLVTADRPAPFLHSPLAFAKWQAATVKDTKPEEEWDGDAEISLTRRAQYLREFLK
jgi:hypothetical protein